MEIQAPKKEKKFLKSIGRIAGVLAQELVLGLGRKYIGKMINKIKIPKKRETLSFLLLLSCTFAFAQYPTTGNKQRLGYQTTGDGLVWRGRASDTVSLKSTGLNNAYIIIDTLQNVMYNYIKTKGGWQFNNTDTVIIQGATMPFDSITFNTAKDGTVGVGEVEYNDTQGSLIQGLKGGNVTNVIGQQLHQRVNNQTGATLTKGTAVYLSGSQGNRITAAKALATSDPTSANTFGIVAESIADNASGYVITEGLITGINTSALTEDSAVYLSPTVAGGLTSTKPQAPNHGVYIGVCVKTNAGSGELFVKIKNGLELDELHDVLITSPASNASLYYKSSEGIWRDTTAALLVSDTASMLTPYFRDADTTSLNLVSRFATKLNISDTSAMLTNYLRSGVAASTYQTKLNGTGFVKATGTTITYDNSTYLTTSLASSTYLPLIGGTVSGTINRQEGSHDGSSSTFYYNILNYFAKRDNNKGNQTAQITFTDRPGTATFENNVRTSDIYLMTAKNLSGGQLGQYLDTTLSIVANQDGGRIGVSKLNPSYKLDVNGTFNASGNSLIGGTLGVTGATTLSNLAGSGTRMVTASSTGLLSTESIPTGTVTSVGGTGTVNGITLTGTVTSSGNLTLGGTLSNVSLTSQVTGTLPILNGGTGATSASAARTALGATVRGANTFTLSDIGAITFLRYNADNTVSQRAADGMRSDLGGSTVGQNMFTLTNPSAITFPRFNADNTVSALDAATFRTAIGAGTGNGNDTVTSVTGTAPIVSSGGTTPAISVNAATSSASGVVSATTQTFGGNKTFNNDVTVSGALGVTGFSTLTGGASIGSMATTSSLTHVIGVNSSNAIGEIGVTDGLKFSSGFLGMDTYKTIAIMDFPNTSAQSSSDLTATVTGAVANTPVLLGVPNGSVISNTSYSAWVSSTNTVTVRFNNYSASSANPASGSFYLIVLNL